MQLGERDGTDRKLSLKRLHVSGDQDAGIQNCLQRDHALRSATDWSISAGGRESGECRVAKRRSWSRSHSGSGRPTNTSAMSCQLCHRFGAAETRRAASRPETAQNPLMPTSDWRAPSPKTPRPSTWSFSGGAAPSRLVLDRPVREWAARVGDAEAGPAQAHRRNARSRSPRTSLHLARSCEWSCVPCGGRGRWRADLASCRNNQCDRIRRIAEGVTTSHLMPGTRRSLSQWVEPQC